VGLLMRSRLPAQALLGPGERGLGAAESLPPDRLPEEVGA
jgi:hypothetical protein